MVISYWIKLGLALSVVSTPFLILAIRKKISWAFFFSWTLTSIFATLTLLWTKNSLEKHFDPPHRLFISILLGLGFAGIGIYLRTLKIGNIRNIGLMFIVFGAIWTALSI